MIRRPLPADCNIMSRRVLEEWARYYDELTDQERDAVMVASQELRQNYLRVLKQWGMSG